ncbi:lysozyme inhibitor LprI family protein [Roseibium aggregatum]|uniref:Lysozyme inhibitor LprI N-terminal domain-containing protein n=1 Tax=Roseibium aggregatum TaxID=187304 RepID=A0A926NZ40_9HYPH|nr:hypothetical protein [Roseibium aggregatum]MBD1549019.1 hypothetical protein [Roseibium aggregatum]
MRNIVLKSILGLIVCQIAGLGLSGAALAQPSYDCSRAAQPDEIAICNDPLLSAADRIIAGAYDRYRGEFQPKREVARRFLSDRNGCGSDRGCIAAVQARMLSTYASPEGNGGTLPWLTSYAKALTGFKAAGLAANGARTGEPRFPGECALTRIEAVTTRFGEPASYENADSGTAISYANGLSQVSYDRDGLYDVKPGQPAVICLMSIPYDCPDGDTRGREYYTLDLETNSDWILGDTQHYCGGA